MLFQSHIFCCFDDPQIKRTFHTTADPLHWAGVDILLRSELTALNSGLPTPITTRAFNCGHRVILSCSLSNPVPCLLKFTSTKLQFQIYINPCLFRIASKLINTYLEGKSNQNEFLSQSYDYFLIEWESTYLQST